MKILETLTTKFSLSEELSKYSTNFNDVIIDYTKNLDVINASLLCNNIPRVIKLTSEVIDNIKNAQIFSSFEEAVDFLSPDDKISLIIVDSLDFLKDEQLKYFLSLQTYPILSFKDLKSFEIQNPLYDENIRYELLKETKNNLFLFKAI